MAKFKVTIDGAEREVEIPNAVDTSSDEFKSQYLLRAVHDHEMGSARKAAKDLKDPAKLLEDEEFRAKALSTWGIDPKAKAALTAEQLEEVRKRVREQELVPLEQKLTKATATIGQLRQTQLHAAILEAARGHVRDEFLARPTPLAKPLIVSMLEEQFGFDEETGAWAVRKGEGYEYASKPEHGRPWMDVTEFVTNWAGQDVAKPFLKDQRQRIPGPGQPPASGGSGKTIAASDQAAFLENLKDIASGKVSVAQS